MPTPDPKSSYLIQEDGVSHFLLEDGSGFILLETGIASGIQYLGGMPEKYSRKRRKDEYWWLDRLQDAKYASAEREKLGIITAPRLPDRPIRRIERQETALDAPVPRENLDVVQVALKQARKSLPQGIDLSQEIMRHFRADLHLKQERLEQAIFARQQADMEDEEQAIVLLLLN